MNKYEKIKELVNRYCDRADSRVFEDWLYEMYLDMTNEQIDTLYGNQERGA